LATRISTATRTALLDTGIDTIWDGGTAVLEIRTGTQPAAATDAASGTLLVSITLPSDAFGAPASGQMAKSGTWQGTAVATGTAGWFRIRDAADTAGRIDGAVGAELTLDNTSISSGGTVTINTATVTMPAS
jgi:hypothetical protein